MLFGSVLGGLGLFLLAIEMMTDGLKLAAGSTLRKLLTQWCSTPFKSVFSGFLMTAIVQSSSAVTIASLGFVNAGLINMRQTLGIIYGSNIGTTMTGWIVAIVGFNLNIESFALPMIGIGMFIKLVKKHGQFASFGLALVGFGLFFVGIDVLKSTFDSLVQTFDISSFNADGISGVFIYLSFGIVMTVLTQSSSASIALIITAVSSDMIGLYAAGSMVIGANIGTTSTAIIAALGATSPAKRVAAAQVLFNLVTGGVALIILPALFASIAWGSKVFSIDTNPAISLALFHSIFNVLGVFIVYPQNNRLASFLERRFLTWEEKESNPKFIDQNIAQTPVLAVNALVLELESISDKIITAYSKAIQPTAFRLTEFQNEIKVINALSSQVSSFIVKIQSPTLDNDTTNNLITLMRVDQYFVSAAICVKRIAEELIKREKIIIPSLEADTLSFFNDVLDFMKVSRSNKYQLLDQFNEHYIALQASHDKLKAALILEGTRSSISVLQMSETIDILVEAIQLNQQWFKAITRLQSLNVKPELIKSRNEHSLIDIN